MNQEVIRAPHKHRQLPLAPGMVLSDSPLDRPCMQSQTLNPTGHRFLTISPRCTSTIYPQVTYHIVLCSCYQIPLPACCDPHSYPSELLSNRPSLWYYSPRRSIVLLVGSLGVLTLLQAQTPEQRMKNQKFAKENTARMGKPESAIKKKDKDQKSPISPIWLGILLHN